MSSIHLPQCGLSNRAVAKTPWKWKLTQAKPVVHHTGAFSRPSLFHWAQRQQWLGSLGCHSAAATQKPSGCERASHERTSGSLSCISFWPVVRVLPCRLAWECCWVVARFPGSSCMRDMSGFSWRLSHCYSATCCWPRDSHKLPWCRGMYTMALQWRFMWKKRVKRRGSSHLQPTMFC